MTPSERKILRQRLERLKNIVPETKTKQKLLAQEIRKIERKLAGKRPLGRPVQNPRKRTKKMPEKRQIDWQKIAYWAARM